MDACTSHLLMTIFIISILGFLCLLVTCLMQSAATSGQERGAIPETPHPILTIADAFDPERGILWSSQVSFLQAIARNASLGECLQVCELSLHRYPELYEGTDPEYWLRFLQRTDLVKVSGPCFKLTANGREFLTLLMAEGNGIESATKPGKELAKK